MFAVHDFQSHYVLFMLQSLSERKSWGQAHQTSASPQLDKQQQKTFTIHQSEIFFLNPSVLGVQIDFEGANSLFRVLEDLRNGPSVCEHTWQVDSGCYALNLPSQQYRLAYSQVFALPQCIFQINKINESEKHYKIARQLHFASIWVCTCTVALSVVMVKVWSVWTFWMPKEIRYKAQMSSYFSVHLCSIYCVHVFHSKSDNNNNQWSMRYIILDV